MPTTPYATNLQKLSICYKLTKTICCPKKQLVYRGSCIPVTPGIMEPRNEKPDTASAQQSISKVTHEETLGALGKHGVRHPETFKSALSYFIASDTCEGKAMKGKK